MKKVTISKAVTDRKTTILLLILLNKGQSIFSHLIFDGFSGVFILFSKIITKNFHFLLQRIYFFESEI